MGSVVGFLAHYGIVGVVAILHVSLPVFPVTTHVGVAGVLSDGSISACTSIRANYHQGNIYTDNFMDVWNNRFEPYRNRDWMKKDDCASCKYWRFCKGGGMHLRDEEGKLILCHYQKLQAAR